MGLEEADSDDEMQLLPPGTEIFEPDEINRVTFQFPTEEDAIVFFEFFRAFASGEIKLQIVKS